jgi:hypothetical protein
VKCSREDGDEDSGCIKFGETLEQRSDWRLLMKGSAPWS